MVDRKRNNTFIKSTNKLINGKIDDATLCGCHVIDTCKADTRTALPVKQTNHQTEL